MEKEPITIKGLDKIKLELRILKEEKRILQENIKRVKKLNKLKNRI